MLQNKLTEIKGRLLEMMFEMYKDMNTDKDGTDYEELYNEIQSSLNEIRGIHLKFNEIYPDKYKVIESKKIKRNGKLLNVLLCDPEMKF